MKNFFGVRHKGNRQIFLLLEDGLGSRMRVVGPQGEVLLRDESEFDLDYLDIDESNMSGMLSPQQLQKAAEIFSEQEKRDAIAAKAAAERQKQLEVLARHGGGLRGEGASARPTQASSARSGSPRPSRSGNASKSAPSRRFSRELTWESSQLSFYRHKIEPLGPKDVFVIHVYDVGRFRFTREGFDANFADVKMNAKYREFGVYSFPEIPERALKFKVSDGSGI